MWHQLQSNVMRDRLFHLTVEVVHHVPIILVLKDLVLFAQLMCVQITQLLLLLVSALHAQLELLLMLQGEDVIHLW